MDEISVIMEQVIQLLQQSVDISVCIVVPKTNIVECSRKSILEDWAVEIALAQKGESSDSFLEANAMISFECTLSNDIVYIIMLDYEHRAYKSYIETLVNMTYDSHNIRKKYREDTSKRRLLASQLLGNSHLDFEMHSNFRAIKCTKNIPRCAVLISVDAANEQMSTSHIIDKVEAWAMQNEYLSKEDICGSVNENLIIFMTTGSMDYKEYEERVDTVCDALISYIATCLNQQVKCCAFIGSAYDKPEQLYRSFDEAKYLYSNYDYYSYYGKTCYYINDYLFEYLYVRLDKGTQDQLLRDINAGIEQSDILESIMLPMAVHDMSPKQSAKELEIHVNTMQQRLQKLKDTMGLNPLHDIRDRALVHIYAILNHKKTIWNAGVIVQQDSVLLQGLQHLSTLLNEVSNGTYQLNVRSVSSSGDNVRLFEMLQEGTLDMAVGSTIGLRELALPKLSVLQYPFLFDSQEEADEVLKAVVLPEVQSGLYDAGVLCLDLWSMGWRNISSKNEPIRVPEDMIGHKIRILASNDIKTYFEEVGAEPIQIYYDNIREALAADIIDCQENPYSNIWGMGIYEYQKYITELNMFYSMEACCVSQKSWQELDEEQKAMLQMTIYETHRWLLNRQKEINQAAKNKLVKAGIQIIIPTEEEVMLWKEKTENIYKNSKYQEILKKIQDMKLQYKSSEEREVIE